MTLLSVTQPKLWRDFRTLILSRTPSTSWLLRQGYCNVHAGCLMSVACESCVTSHSVNGRRFVGWIQLMMCVFQPTPVVDVDELSDESRCSTCTCESCVKARYCGCLCDHNCRCVYDFSCWPKIIFVQRHCLLTKKLCYRKHLRENDFFERKSSPFFNVALWLVERFGCFWQCIPHWLHNTQMDKVGSILSFMF